MNRDLYPAVILLLLIVGFVPAVAFISQHRPRQWRRVAAWDASGFVIVAAAIYLRNIILVWTRWPGPPPKRLADVLFGIGSLLFIDALLILRIVSYRAFVAEHRQRVGDGRGSGGDPPA